MTINTTKQAYSQFDSGEDMPKSGEHKMTNREWLESLPDDEFVIAVEKSFRDCSTCWYESNGCNGDCYLGHWLWLKAEHREVSE